jgi:hypothetical protein
MKSRRARYEEKINGMKMKIDRRGRKRVRNMPPEERRRRDAE